VKYDVDVIKTEEGYAISCPSLPGCHSQGTTEQEALENIKDAIHDYTQVKEELEKKKKHYIVEVG
jgi:predicted RNase H-like HicB family nuclease